MERKEIKAEWWLPDGSVGIARSDTAPRDVSGGGRVTAFALSRGSHRASPLLLNEVVVHLECGEPMSDEPDGRWWCNRCYKIGWIVRRI